MESLKRGSSLWRLSPHRVAWPTLIAVDYRQLIPRYRLTLLFAVTAILLTAAAAVLVNNVVGNLAERNLIRIEEANSTRDGLHIRSMIRGDHSTVADESDALPHSATIEHQPQATPQHRASEEAPDPDMPKKQHQQTERLSLEKLSGPEGLPRTYQSLVAGRNIVNFHLLDPEGTVVWSNHGHAVSRTSMDAILIQRAADGGVSSRFIPDYEVVGESGESHRTDVVQTTLPLTDTPSGKIIGVMEIHRSVAQDVAFQVEDAKRVVLWTTVGAMGGLFLFLFGFILIADATIQRSRRRELAVVEDANSSLEARVQERTRELKEAQEQLIRSEKLAALGQLAGGVAHDLRNPLGAIKNALYYLKRRLAATDLAEANPKIPQFLQIAEDEVEHSKAIINDLMSFARVGAPTLAPTEVGVIVASVLSTMDLRDNVRVNRQLDSGLPKIMADKEQLQRVFINLANNAHEAMPYGGELTIAARVSHDDLEIAFQDSGVGISEENMRKIFDPLFTTKTKGTGLGLAVCQQIVGRHGGTIQVSSVPGQGSTFTVSLPLNNEVS